MRTPIPFAYTTLGLLIVACPTFAASNTNLINAAKEVLADDQATAERAIAKLREAGPDGLNTLFDAHEVTINKYRNPILGPSGVDAELWQRLSKALNTVGGQYDCHASGLYWYTDFDEAKKVARETGKPILSLRLLGQLTEECSCANSRFFRTALYANKEISNLLRDQFVLHWKSVRPVPKVTIDFGDGRKLERTLTGNSIHYVLDADGQPIDAIPGLYGPKVFRRLLTQAQQKARVLASVKPEQREEVLRFLHAQTLRDIQNRWKEDLEKAGLSKPVPTSPVPAKASTGQGAVPTARAAAPIAVGKSAVEIPLLNAVALEGIKPGIDAEGKELSDKDWQKIAALYADDAKLDASSVALMREQNPTAIRAARVAVTKRKVEDPLLRVVAQFQRSIALDTVRNEYLYHRQIIEWFVRGEKVTQEVDQLNQRVYAELFLTPDSDPWLGLVPENVYTGLRDNGIVDGGGR